MLQLPLPCTRAPPFHVRTPYSLLYKLPTTLTGLYDQTSTSLVTRESPSVDSECELAVVLGT
ncbi:uncharacterized protein BDR25DRAFT_110565 [Lindgomyces ingoldianus]|uniref:Uncharacterized protein n=1 Tax=Lindgomyces ingoldianus TaxID=673940 RepID=A0ACB6R7X6_9PLEO|nr:uncharacterized protein BDR25DRAFT_110565 [Lindgomyces ingoldianus]KAF2474627.1 hypothetical protein BDR25DRAFT_110565 [Lindgomyces ingoldianus]